MRRNEASTSGGGGGGSSSRGETVVVDCGRRKSSCGYCKSSARTSISHGLWAHSITVDDYQALLDRGWRRSGCFLYKPEMERTCCPSYTIRLKASDFIPSKEQLRVTRRLRRFLDGERDMKKSDEVMEDQNISKDTCICACHVVSSSETNQGEAIINSLSDQVDNAVHRCTEGGEFPSNIQLPKASVKMVSQAKRKLLVEGAEELVFTCNIAFLIAATIRRTQSTKKEERHGAEADTLSHRSIAEKLVTYLHQLEGPSGLKIRACNGHINYYTSTGQASSSENVKILGGSEKSAMVCKGKGCCLSKSSDHPQGKRRRLEIRLKRSSFDPEEFALYKRYQMKVHKDKPEKVTENSYRIFLVDTPLVYVPPSGDGDVPPCGFGSFHQQYLIDGQLVAVGVFDILPKCLSSKYLFWDPDFAFLSLGKYSALQEIDWVRENQLHCFSLQYYYLGYYIHTCSKMRYKAAYNPSELLCPLRYQWVPCDIARPLLDRKPYVVLSDFPRVQNGQSSPACVSDNILEVQHVDDNNDDLNDVVMEDYSEVAEPENKSSDDESSLETSGEMSLEIENGNVGDILIGLKGSRVRYKDLQRAFGPNERNYLESQLQRYMRVVGPELAERMVYSLG